MTTQTKPEQEYLQHLREGRFMLQRARGGGAVFFPPRIAEPGTGVEDLEWVAASGRGHVYAATVNRKRPPEPDVSIVLVNLEEGPRMMSRVEGVAPADVHIGMAVQARVVAAEPHPYVVFDPV